METEAEEWSRIEAELWSEKGGDTFNVEALIDVILVTMYGTIGCSQLKYDVKELSTKKEGDIIKKNAFIKVHKKYGICK